MRISDGTSGRFCEIIYERIFAEITKKCGWIRKKKPEDISVEIFEKIVLLVPEWVSVRFSDRIAGGISAQISDNNADWFLKRYSEDISEGNTGEFFGKLPE